MEEFYICLLSYLVCCQICLIFSFLGYHHFGYITKSLMKTLTCKYMTKEKDSFTCSVSSLCKAWGQGSANNGHLKPLGFDFILCLCFELGLLQLSNEFIMYACFDVCGFVSINSVGHRSNYRSAFFFNLTKFHKMVKF